MTPTPLDAKPQGAQLKRYDISSYLSDAGGKWCKYAEAAERIEKLESALAEARRDAERYRFLRDLESPFRIYLDNERLETLWAHTLDEAVDAASQPEKDANHG